MINSNNDEISVIQAVFAGGLTPHAVEVIDKLEPEMFGNHFYQRCWAVIKRLASAGDLIEPYIVGDEVEAQGGANTLIEQCKNVTGSPANIKGYAKRVRQAHYLRGALKVMKSAIEDIESVNNPSHIGKIAGKLEKAIGGLTLETDHKLPRKFDDIMKDYVKVIDERMSGQESQRMIKTGIESFDELTGGFNLSDLIVLGGCPGMGKTEFLVRMTRGVITSGMGALMFSMEMDEFQVVERAVSGEGNLSYSKLRNPQGMDQEDFGRFSMGCGRLAQTSFYVQDQAGMTIEQICAQATRHKHEHPETALIGVDYLGLIKTDRAERQDIALGDISRRLKQLAKELKTPVVLLVQLVSKTIEARPINDRKPKASDIKDSSRVQDDADWIIFPYRHKVYDESAHDIAEITLGKARHGVQGATCYQQFINGHFVDCDQAMAYQEVSSYAESKQPKQRKHRDF